MTALLLATLFSLNAPAPTVSPVWPQWRGPKNDGHSPETNLPAKWSESENLAWKLKLPGEGASTPCIAEDRIFLTVPDGVTVYLMCIGTDGHEKWRKPMGGPNRYYQRAEGTDASASPSTDGKHVWAFAGTGHLACFDLDGRPAWEFNVQDKYGKFNIQFGIHQTPVLYKGRLFVSLIHKDAKLLIALDAATGKEIWKHNRQSDSPRGVESPDVYASPFIWEKGDQALLISHGDDYCTAHRLDDGSEVWRVTELNPKAQYNRHWRAVSSPLVTPDLIVVPSCKRGVTVAIDPAVAAGRIDPGSTGEKWRLAKDTPDVPSPILVDDLIYIMGEGGKLYAYEAATGKPVYEQAITNMRHRASPLFADGRLYLVGREGVTVVVKPGREFEQIAKNTLPDTLAASPAVAGGRIYLRGFGNLWAIGGK
jgi:outer membrane protein assembly factor BamB